MTDFATMKAERNAVLDELAAAVKAASEAAGGQTPIVEIYATHTVVGEYVSPDGRGTRDCVSSVIEVTVSVANGGAGPHLARDPRDITVLKTATFSGGEISSWRIVGPSLMAVNPEAMQRRREAKVCEFQIEAIPPSRGRGRREGEPACTAEIWAVVDNERGAYFERRRPGTSLVPWAHPPSQRWIAEDGSLVSTETGKMVRLLRDGVLVVQKIDREHALSVLRSLI